MLQRGELVLGSPGDQGEQRERRGRKETVQHQGEAAVAAGAPPRGQPQPAGTLTGPGKQDNFRQTECTENWILQPLTLLLGPL